jgi:hypothetical protein
MIRYCGRSRGRNREDRALGAPCAEREGFLAGLEGVALVQLRGKT